MNFGQEISKVQYGPSMMEDSIVQKILREERIISRHFSECYELLPQDKLDLLLRSRPEIQQMMVRYIRGEIPCDGFSEREKNLMEKIQKDYKIFLKERQDASEENTLSVPFKINVDELNRSVYDNLYHRISFRMLEEKENIKDMEQARKIGVKLGIKNLPKINN
ncbi:MAG: hypothetical protein WC472_00490 [Candidatus Paceibacterota bacterium]